VVNVFKLCLFIPIALWHFDSVNSCMINRRKKKNQLDQARAVFRL